MQQKHSEEPDPRQKQGSCSRSTDNLLVDQCPSCSTPLECYDEETVSTAIVCLATFIHREPVMAASLLPNMFLCVSRFVYLQEQLSQIKNYLKETCEKIKLQALLNPKPLLFDFNTSMLNKKIFYEIKYSITCLFQDSC